MNRPLRVFLCHSNNDKPTVRELYQKLRAEPWIQPWLDEEELYPGQDWNMEIEKAVEAADAIIVCLTKNSINKEGYVQREIRIALDYADYKPEGTLFIIPVRLEECTPPKRLARWQYADYFEGQRERAFEKLLVSLKRRADALNLNIVRTIYQKGDNNKASVLEEKKAERKQKRPKLVKPKSVTIVSVTSNKIVFSNGIELMRVPAGEFLMGSELLDQEKPPHTVYIPYDYWMARFVITNEQYNTYVKIEKIGHPVLGWEWKKDHPVVCISWKEAKEYCGWLNSLIKDELPSGYVLRLPTEVEWEKSARGSDSRIFPWGNDYYEDKIVVKCNVHESNKGGTTPVGSYSPQSDSPFGCADMAGNVWEYTHSLYKPYPYSATDGREDEENIKSSLDFLVERGGSWKSNYGYARASHRNPGSFNYRNADDTGFRLVVAPLLE